MNKRCTVCRKTYNVSNFGKSNRSRNGYTQKCNNCNKIAKQKYETKQAFNYCQKCMKNERYTHASFGLPNGKKVSCADHKTEDMIDLNRTNCLKCEELGKQKSATFGYPTDRKRISCATHKKDGMINIGDFGVRCRKCYEKGKFKTGVFGFPTERKRISCSKHKVDGMVDLVHDICKTCKKDKVYKNACFGFLTDGKKVYCDDHKEDGMVNLSSSNDKCLKCLENNIEKRPSFGFLKDGKRLYCDDHKEDGMINLKKLSQCCSICKENDIIKTGSFGYSKKDTVFYCFDHKKDDMIDIHKPKCVICLEEDRDSNASFGYLDDRNKISCLEHRKDGMVNLTIKECVVCKEEGKYSLANYGKLFEPKTHCRLHSLPNEYVRNNPKCEECKNRPCYGVEKVDDIPKRCEEHKKDGDIDMVSRECTLCRIEQFIPSSQDRCSTCLGWNTKRNNNRGVKEHKIKTCLTKLSQITGIPEPVNDKVIQEGCSRRRPDFYYKNFSPLFDAIVEGDEFQHSYYSCSVEGELRRMINLYEEGTGGTPIIFIRFNPDPYYYKDTIIKSYKGREDKLTEVIKGLKNKTDIDFYIGVIYLFYDNFDTVKIEPLSYEIKDKTVLVKHKHPHLQNSNHVFPL